MSITVSTDVFCDRCGDWIHGCTGGRPDAPKARRVAATGGWCRRLDGNHVLDLCPACTKGPKP